MVDVVIARYKEKLDWVEKFDLSRASNVRFYLYDKSDESFEVSVLHNYKKLPNIGREAHTFLHHIVSNYDNLAEETLFLQGNPFDHQVNINRLQDLIEHKANYSDYRTFAIVTNQDLFVARSKHEYNIIFQTMYEQKYSNPPQYWFSSGAQYIVKKEAIHRHSKESWSKLLSMSETEQQFPWSMERIWMYIYSDVLLR
jgi:hypothetical protein